MKALLFVLRFIFVVCLPVLLITAVIAGAVNCSWVYTHGFEKYDVRQSLADYGLRLTDADMKGIARDFIHYFNSGDEYIDLAVQQNGKSVAVFTYEENIHFKDVKKLFRLDYYAALGTFLYCLAFTIFNLFFNKGVRRKKLARDSIIGGGFTLALMGALGLGSLLDFNDLFLKFHMIAFSNEFWSAEGNMLLLFPGGFWYDIAIYCVAAICVLAILIIGMSWTCLLYQRGKEQK